MEKNRIGGCSRGVVYSGAGEEETQCFFFFGQKVQLIVNGKPRDVINTMFTTLKIFQIPKKLN